VAELSINEWVHRCERRRSEFNHASVRVLFVGESIPHNRTFFYDCNSILYDCTKQAFKEAYDILFSNTCGSGSAESDFLWFFEAKGCYLVDLCAVPVNHLKRCDKDQFAMRLAYRQQGIPTLAECIQLYQPEAVVVVMKEIRREVLQATCQSVHRTVRWVDLTRGTNRIISGHHFPTELAVYGLPFPVRSKRNRDNYVNGLARLLPTLPLLT